MSSPEPPRYRTTNWETYNAALRSRGIATIWFNRDMQCLAQPSGKTDRNPTFSDAAVRFCLTMKGLFGLPLRQATGFVHSLLQLSWLEWPVPDYSTLCHRQMLIKVVIPYRPQPAGLHLLIDSTGAKMLGQSEWARKKQGADYRRKCRKVHLGVDAQTLEIRAVAITDSRIGDAPILPEMLKQIPESKPVLSVSTDGAYDTKACHETIALRQATATIPVQTNGKPWRKASAGAPARNEILANSEYLGRPLWKRWSGYHRRSQRLRCVAKNFWSSGSWPKTSTVRLLNYRSAASS